MTRLLYEKLGTHQRQDTLNTKIIQGSLETGSMAFRKEMTTAHTVRVPESSLYASLAKSQGLRSPFLQDLYTSTLSPIFIILSWMEYFPIAHRKAILDFCRIQAPVYSNSTLSTTFAPLHTVHASVADISGVTSTVVMTMPDLVSLLDTIYPFPLLCCLLSYFCRAETPTFSLLAEFQDQKRIGLDKEMQAALFYETEDQHLDYRHILFDVGNANSHPQLQTGSDRLRVLYAKGLGQIAQRLGSKYTHPLLPRYNSRKNVSYQTIYNYYTCLDSESEPSSGMQMDITTLDLLRMYYVSGERVTGPMEMRLAWFFNDLKPRVYYCLGGTDFWHGMYIQDIANMFSEMIPSTHPHSRYTVSRIGPLDYSELLITYDYSSFTSSLGELKYFIFWLAHAVQDVVVTLLDVRDGLIEVSLKRILLDYNDAINRHQVFSVERFSEGEELYELRQGRNGSLGTKGNIVFSTTLHGLALGDITGTPDDDCCVGDDALAKIRAWFISMFITCVNNLGSINESKFTTIPPPSEETSRMKHQFKFLKRPLFLNHNNIPELGRLDFFPSVADVLRPLGDGVHTATPGYNRYAAAKTFAMQCGRFLTIHVDAPIIMAREVDLDLILGSFRMGYQVFGLPVAGGIPGDFHIKVDGVQHIGHFFCPPVDSLEVFSDHWLGLLLHRLYGRECTMPITVGSSIPPPLHVSEGQTFNASSDYSVLQLGVDLKFLEKQVNTRVAVFDWNLLEEVQERMISRMQSMDVEPLLITYTVVASPPSWWTDVISYEYSENLVEDPNEAWDRVTSIMSGSVI